MINREFNIKDNTKIQSHPQAGDIILPTKAIKTKIPTSKKEYKTHEINQIALLLNKHAVQSRTDLKNKMPSLLKDYIEKIDPEKRKEIKAEDLGTLFEKAFSKYAKVKDDVIVRGGEGSVLSRTEIGGLLEKFKSLPQKEEVKTESDIEIARFEENYDQLEAAEAKMEAVSNALKTRVANKNIVYVHKLIIGAGDTGTACWVDMNKGFHERTNQLLGKDPDSLPGVLMLAENRGNWQLETRGYTIAQTVSTYDNPDAPSNPKDFTTRKNYEEDAYPNAKLISQANMRSLVETEAPVILDAKVISVEKREKHQKDWSVAKANCRVNVQFKLKEEPFNVKLEIEEATKALYQKLYGKAPSDQEYSEFFSKFIRLIINDSEGLNNTEILKKISTDHIIAFIKNEDKFISIKDYLDLPARLSQVEFANNIGDFLDDIVENTLQKAKKDLHIPISTRLQNQEFGVIKPDYDSYETPIIRDGKIVLIHEILFNKEIYADQLNVCAGFGNATSLSDKQLDKSMLKKLSKFNHRLGFTPVIDGNKFMLTASEEKPVKKDIIIYGGGGNASACYRKAFFRQDISHEHHVFAKDNQFANEITMFSRAGYRLAGSGNLARSALTFADENGQLCCGDLVKVEEGKNGKVLVYMKDAQATFEKKPIVYSDEMKNKHPLIEIPDPANPTKTIFVRKFECDQFIYTIGLEPKPIKDMFSEYAGDYKIFQDDKSHMPLGVKTQDDAITFWGGTGIALGPTYKTDLKTRQSDLEKVETEYQTQQETARKALSQAKSKEEKAQAEYQKTKADMLKYKVEEYREREKLSQERQINTGGIFTDNLRDWIVMQRISRDSEWPGVMPQTRAASRKAGFLQRTELFGMQDSLQKEVDSLKAKAKENKTEVARLLKEEKQAKLKMEESPSASNIQEAETVATKLQQAKQERTLAIEALEIARAKLKEAKSEFSYVNVNLDDIEHINDFLVFAGIDDITTRVNFLRALLEERQLAYETQDAGVDAKTLQKLMKDFGIDDKVFMKGHSVLAIRKKNIS
jgi:hypothetical protein